jgi:hypothetical protein
MQPILVGQRLSLLNQAITVLADASAGAGAPARYSIRVALPAGVGGGTLSVDLPFQRGPVGTDGSNINGISDEAVLEILIHRLRAFQSGPGASADNAAALSHLEGALQALEARSARRRAAGVEGTTRDR